MASYESEAGADYSVDRVSGWAVGGTVFAGTIMLTAGVFQGLSGLAAILNDQFFVVARHYAFDLDVTAWGWIHLILGIVVAIAGGALFARKPWAAVFALVLAFISAISMFFFIPYYPFWAIVIIALDVWVIWSLTRPGMIGASN